MTSESTGLTEEAVNDYVRKRFPSAHAFAPYYTASRTLLPPDYSRSALVVPLDYPEVVPRQKIRTPYRVFEEMFGSRLPFFERFLADLAPHMQLRTSETDPDDGAPRFTPNSYMWSTDLRVLVGMVGHFRPRKYVEIGSGYSTRICRQAVSFHKTGTSVTCVDPSPRVGIDGVADVVVSSSLTELDPAFFSRLEANDILFLDGSHLCFHGSDVPHFFLRILPVLAEGVVVHIHDIFLPDEYPERCDNLQLNEQYVLGAFLLGNASWEVLLPVQFCYRQGLLLEGASFWMLKTGRQ